MLQEMIVPESLHLHVKALETEGERRSSDQIKGLLVPLI